MTATVTTTMQNTAVAAANAAANGSKNSAYMTSIQTSLGSGYKRQLLQNGVVKWSMTASGTLPIVGNTFTLPTTGTVTTNTAAAIGTGTWKHRLVNASDSAVYIESDCGTVASGKPFTLSADLDGTTSVTINGSSITGPSFDTVVTPSSSLATLKTWMTSSGVHYPSNSVFGLGGPLGSAEIDSVNFQNATGYPAYLSQYGYNMFNYPSYAPRRMLPWVCIEPADSGFVNDGTWAIEIWDAYAEYFSISLQQWVGFNGATATAPNNSFDMADWPNSAAPSGTTLKTNVGSPTGRYRFKPTQAYYPWAIHNNLLFQEVPINDCLSIHVAFWAKIVPWTAGGSIGTFPTNKVICQAGCDGYLVNASSQLQFPPGPLCGNARTEWLTASDQQFHFIHYKPNTAGSWRAQTPYDASLLSRTVTVGAHTYAAWPVAEQFLTDFPPTGYA